MSVAHLYDLSGECAVVTGAGRGIGEGIARTLAAAGASVVCAARRGDEIARVAKQIEADGGKAIAVPTDVTDPDAVTALAREARDAFGRLDVWVNNAGGSPVQRRLTKLSREDWDAAVALNLTAIWHATVIAAEHLEEGGRIINISSKVAVGPAPGSGHYAAMKAGVNSLTMTFAAELGPRIRVNGIMPGAVPTEIMMKALRLEEKDLPKLEEGLNLPLERLGTPQDLGAAALFLASPASSWVTGQTIAIDGGM